MSIYGIETTFCEFNAFGDIPAARATSEALSSAGFSCKLSLAVAGGDAEFVIKGIAGDTLPSPFLLRVECLLRRLADRSVSALWSSSQSACSLPGPSSTNVTILMSVLDRCTAMLILTC